MDDTPQKKLTFEIIAYEKKRKEKCLTDMKQL